MCLLMVLLMRAMREILILGHQPQALSLKSMGDQWCGAEKQQTATATSTLARSMEAEFRTPSHAEKKHYGVVACLRNCTLTCGRYLYCDTSTLIPLL